jgi:hypothetical protein
MNVQIIHAQLGKQHDRLGGCGPILHRNVEDFPFPANYNRESERKKTPRNVQMKLMEQNILLSGSLTGQVRDSLQWYMRLCFNAISIPTAKPA